MTDWNKRFLDLAEHISTWSKDKSRKVGAIIVNDDKRIVSFGYNGFPSGIDDDIEERHERPAKYDWVVHAEENAIANAARIGVSTMGTTIYLNLFPCARCSGVLINSGIKKVVVSKEPNFEDSKYGNEFRISDEKLREAGVEIVLPEKRIFTINIKDIPEDEMEDYTKEVMKKFKKKFKPAGIPYIQRDVCGIESKKNEYSIFIDQKEFIWDEQFITGKQIKGLGDVPLDDFDDYGCWLVMNTIEDDKQIADDEDVDLSQPNRDKFFTGSLMTTEG